MTLLTALGAGLLGLVLGPWLVTWIERVPQREPQERVPLLAPPRCRSCSAERRGIAARVPLRRPACPSCGTRPPVRDVVVHVVSAAACGVAGGFAGPGALLPAMVFLAVVMVVVTFVDIDTHRIPDRITLPAPFVALGLLAVASVAEGNRARWTGALAGAVLFFVVLGVFHLVYPAGMGFGDVKFAPTLGLYLGWIHPLLVVYALLAASVIGVALGLPAVIRRGRRSEFPFGPALCAGTLLTIVAADAILTTAGL